MVSKRLSEISIGKKALILDFEHDDIILKLMEMGCMPGEIVTIEKKAPFGDPISIRVAGYQLSLRLDEASKIIVKEL
jgi:ferrous iron transport protein A